MRRDSGAAGAILIAALLLGVAPAARAADYSVSFGELQGADHKTVVPTTSIRLCEKSTGYRFGYEIVPKTGNSFAYYTVFYLPAPAARVDLKNASVSRQGKQIKTEQASASGPVVEEYWFDKGDPGGAWKIDVVVQNAVVATVKFDVVPAAHCP